MSVCVCVRWVYTLICICLGNNPQPLRLELKHNMLHTEAISSAHPSLEDHKHHSRSGPPAAFPMVAQSKHMGATPDLPSPTPSK